MQNISQMSQPPSTVFLHPQDNICVAARLLEPGEWIEAGEYRVALRESVRLGHKIALSTIRRGEPIRKYGQVIGFASEEVPPGAWVHVHNLALSEFARDPASATEIPAPPEPVVGRTFEGYLRPSGKAGTRNYLALVSSVNCSATVCKAIARRFDQSVLKDFPNVDGIVAFTHGDGCGMEYNGLKHQMLARTLGGMAKHPNVGGYLVVGLGCETSTPAYILESARLVQLENRDGLPATHSHGLPVMSMQDLGGTTKTIEAGIRYVAELLPRINDVRRTTLPASEIVLGTNCGGSDGNSGITANPALGVASDLLVAAGGTSALAETTEIYGAEHLLTRRAVSVEVADKLLERIEWWKWYAGLFGLTCDNNPSLGNKEGGLTTIAEKSLGAVAKAGSTALVDVYQYSEEIRAKGLVVMDTPGLDAPSVTGLVAGGCNVFVFTTGRGSCFGCKPTPSIKVATNTPMYERMSDDMDLNAGTILSHGKSVAEMGREIFEEILAVASGKKTKSEQHGYGDEEFVPWWVGPVL
jgi:altronate hydrolase